MDKIVLKNMEFTGHTGCLEEEKINGQKFIITVEMEFDRITGVVTDDLDDTVDYAVICDKTREIVENDRGNLIEHLAGLIADMVLDNAPECRLCTVTVSKPQAPVDAVFETMEVSIERKR